MIYDLWYMMYDMFWFDMFSFDLIWYIILCNYDTFGEMISVSWDQP